MEPTTELTPLSPKLIRMRMAVLAVWAALALLVVVGLAIAAANAGWWLWLLTGVVFAVCAALCGWLSWLIPRQVRRMGYAVRASDLVIQRGIMFTRTTVVPFGRLQFVDVGQGPFERAFGLAQVKLHTASAGTDAVIPGLPRADADRLRELLAARGEARLAGL